jgi:hypothetical protein
MGPNRNEVLETLPKHEAPWGAWGAARREAPWGVWGAAKREAPRGAWKSCALNEARELEWGPNRNEVLGTLLI